MDWGGAPEVLSLADKLLARDGFSWGGAVIFLRAVATGELSMLWWAKGSTRTCKRAALTGLIEFFFFFF